ncbi:unnamed protein product [Ostreobium quekettii]|uniref:Uncharacterized protein n=1 Tax=Ostreobium quekettii TaxID=121088 RepID=A0A8S1IW43_9CHLO|nr:unnamed protein product [Ostreobium quekettii]
MTGRPRRSFRKQVGDYYLGRTIGEGAYAKVKYGEHVRTGERVAIKVRMAKGECSEPARRWRWARAAGQWAHGQTSARGAIWAASGSPRDLSQYFMRFVGH